MRFTPDRVSLYPVLLRVLVVVCLIVALWPSYGPPHFRYTGSDPDQPVLNLGIPLAFFIIDPRQSPPLIIGPLAQIFIPIQVAVVTALALAPRFLRWCDREIRWPR